MVKRTQTICWQTAGELFECGLTILWGWYSKNRKETKGKKVYQSYHYSSDYYLKSRPVPLVSAVICRPDSPCLSRRALL